MRFPAYLSGCRRATAPQAGVGGGRYLLPKEGRRHGYDLLSGRWCNGRESELLIPGSRATFNFIVKSDRLLFTAKSIAIHNVFIC